MDLGTYTICDWVVVVYVMDCLMRNNSKITNLDLRVGLELHQIQNQNALSFEI
jgi:hypothetical protein